MMQCNLNIKTSSAFSKATKEIKEKLNFNEFLVNLKIKNLRAAGILRHKGPLQYFLLPLQSSSPRTGEGQWASDPSVLNAAVILKKFSLQLLIDK
ncbi:CLUMA_CG020516, isoform A [Clunio marinus]|uniref:CLUMA_CG020516, isoform A n=1 Tax=Clunio marinus TaxID=568069 RepID=A0A1J1J584_9DIPT|nr:CLUMA_CG020516, isoform A [Clunio marinus]